MGGCIASALLWFALNADLENALWWVVKDAGPFGSPLNSVRLDKVVICLSWSALVVSMTAFRYELNCSQVFKFLILVLLTLSSISVLQINVLAIPYLYLAVKFPALWLIFVFAKLAISTLSSYLVLVRGNANADKHALALAVSLGASGLMVWNGLFDIAYPGISWR